MENLILLLPVLGCLAMGAVMWMMMRGKHHQGHDTTTDPVTQDEISRLRAEIALLKHDQQAARDEAGGPGGKP